MTARCVIAGSIAPRSQPAAMRVRGVVVAPTRTPIVDLDPCPCGKPNCDRDEWHELMREGVEDDTAQDTPAPLFAWTDANLGGALDSGGKLRWDWSQPEQDWIRTGC